MKKIKRNSVLAIIISILISEVIFNYPHDIDPGLGGVAEFFRLLTDIILGVFISILIFLLVKSKKVLIFFTILLSALIIYQGYTYRLRGLSTFSPIYEVLNYFYMDDED